MPFPHNMTEIDINKTTTENFAENYINGNVCWYFYPLKDELFFCMKFKL